MLKLKYIKLGLHISFLYFYMILFFKKERREEEEVGRGGRRGKAGRGRGEKKKISALQMS